jgi:flagellar biogenesis protein FliO
MVLGDRVITNAVMAVRLLQAQPEPTTTMSIPETAAALLNPTTGDVLRESNDIFSSLGSSETLTNSGGNIFFYIAGYTLLIGLLIAGLFLLRKFLLGRAGMSSSSTYMRVIDRMPITTDKQIMIVETEKNVMILGVTMQRIETLGTMDKDELKPLPPEQAVNRFGNLFTGALGRYRNKPDDLAQRAADNITDD